jgi:hypothetical protein
MAEAQNVAPPSTLAEALAAEFKCPVGAHDSGGGPIPGTVVRWCEIERDGRLVYHGPVWRWYPSGKLEGKEYYVNGAAAGVWPSYYENGHMSSLGALKSGRKMGLWKYWDEGGRLRTEVTYSKFDYVRVDYYSSGRKKAVGVAAESGKIGEWTYWDRNGNEKARCDFGRGVFSVSGGPCQTIANELDPKGYSLPIPIADREDDGKVALRVDSEAFRFTTPQGWTADVDAGRQEELPLVLYPRGKNWRAPGANMYVRVCFKGGKSFEQTIKDDNDDFEQNVEDYREQSQTKGRSPTGREYVLESISYKPVIATDSPFSIVASNQVHEKIAYLDASDKVTLLLVLTADSQAGLNKSSPAFQSLLESFR